jgi:hypothetical protein
MASRGRRRSPHLYTNAAADGRHSSAGHTLKKWMEHQLDLIGSATS